MKNHIDQLFKGKLEHHALPTPMEAWSKIEAALPKKNNIIVWWRLAAVFLLFGMLVSAIYWLQANEKENTQPMLAEKKVGPPSQSASQSAEEKATELSIIKADANQKQKRKVEKPRIEKVQANEKASMAEVVAGPKNETAIEMVPQPVAKETVAIAKTEKPIVLEFTLEPIESHLVTRAADRNSGFKKVWAKAKDIKNGESTFDLQNFKENLFAHNTKKDKTKNNQQ